MARPALKEITPVVYKDHAVKVLHHMKSAPQAECFPLHWHDRVELLLITQGSMEIQLGDERQVAAQGSLAIINVRQPHRGIAGDKGVEYQVLMFEPGTFQNNTPASQRFIAPILQNQTVFCHVSQNEEVLKTVRQILQLHEDPYTNPLQIMGLTYYLLGLFSRHCLGTARVTAQEDAQFKPVLEYMNAHFTEKISTKTLSRAFGYDEAYFCRRFKRTTGITVMKYLQILRLEYAQQLLKKKDRNISDIAVLCGFSDIYYFTRCFSRHFGIAPNEFRKAHGG